MLRATRAHFILFVTVLAAAGGWFGCSSKEEPASPIEAVATTQQALEPSACDPNAPFGPAQPAFTGYRIANGVAFSQDGKKVYVSTKTNPADPYTIRAATRDTTALPFGTLNLVPALNPGSENRSPWLSGDGLTLYLTSFGAATSWQRRLYIATRSPTEAEFTGTQPLPSTNPPGIINFPGLHNQDAYFLSGQLYYASEYPSGTRDLYSSTLSGGTYQTPVGLGAVNMADKEDYHPVLSSDGQTLYFASNRSGIGGDTNGDIWVTKRSANGFFDNATITNLYELNTSWEDFPVALADNGCTLYFASAEESGHGATNTRLYRATRAATIPALVTTTIKIIGSGSVSTAPFACSSTCSAQGAPNTIVAVQASASAHWSGSCASQGGSPSSDGVVAFTNGGVCVVDFRSAGNGTTGSLCFSDQNCTSGTYCVFGQCSTGCDLDCTGKAVGAANGCGGQCGGGGSACVADVQCATGLYCSGGSCTPSWQRDLPIAAWYTADANYVDEPAGGGPISQWNDRSPNNRHATQTHPPGKPQYVTNGWSATRPSVRFSGGQLMSVPTWTGSPTGTNQPFTVLAVMRSSAPQSPATPQHSAVAGWWGEAGYVWAGLKIADGVALPELMRTWSLGTSQIYTGPHDLGQNVGHVVAWRYAPTDQTLKVTVDGTTTSSWSMPPIPALASLPFIIGAKSTLPTGLFQGDIAELIVVGSTLTDAQLQEYTDYARTTWGDLPLQGSANPCIKDNNQPALDGTRCDDNTPSTYGDRCVSGTCAGIVPPAGGPAGLAPTAWYHAGTAEVNLTDGRVSVWFDRTSNHLDALQGFYNGRPTLAPLGWNGNKPTIQFNAGQLIRRDTWPGIPSGNDSPLTVLAVMRSGAAQNAGVASWWNTNGYAGLVAQLASTSPGSTLHLLRRDDNPTTQDFTGPALDGGLHVVAWRFIPSTPEVAKLTVDGTTAEVTHATSLTNLTMTEMVIGAANGNGASLFNGDISEIAIIPRSLTDAEITSFRSYAQAEWGGLTTPCEANCAGKASGEDNGCGQPCGGSGAPCTATGECGTGLECFGGSCTPHCVAVPTAPECHCGNTVKDADETDVDCGGACPACGSGKECGDAGDCAAGLDCGENNGACFGKARKKKVCWSSACTDGVAPSECGSASSPCGQNCECVTGCNADDPASSCPASEVCKKGLGHRLLSRSRDVCLDPDLACPSNDPALCGKPLSACGPTCVCQADCSTATCADPSGGCPGNVCPDVCGPGQETPSGAACPAEHTAYLDPDGIQRCRPVICTLVPVVPPLCGTPDAECGPECPICTPDDTRVCGIEPKCHQDRGPCPMGQVCNGVGQCETPAVDPVPNVWGPTGPTPVTDLPPSATAGVGTVPGSFSVSEQGTPVYKIPIEVPPGRAGMEPDVSLVYSGGRTATDSAVGWHIEGLSKITRCPHIQALDGYSAPIKNDESDFFCIDGKRLSVIDSGVYGADAAEYRTLVDSFARIRSVRETTSFEPEPRAGVTLAPPSARGPDYFRVWTKDGRILTYGRTRDSLIMSHTGVRYSWLLSRIEDRALNTILFNYDNFLDNTAAGSDKVLPAVVRPSSIVYTGSGNAAGNRLVTFAYEDRDDQALRYLQGGLASVTTQRLKKISTWVNNWEPVRTYRLEYYDYDGLPSRLHQVYECVRLGGPGEVCKSPTTFSYKQEHGFSWDARGLDLTSGMQLDMDGDGLNDFIVTDVSVTSPSISPQLKAGLLVTDVALMGVSIVAPQIGVPVSALWGDFKETFWGADGRPQVNADSSVLFGTGDRASPVTPVDLAYNFCAHATFLLDWDRDGKDDLAEECGSAGSNEKFLHLERSAGNGSFIGHPELNVWLPLYKLGAEGPGAVLYDIDGDSLQDVIACKDEWTLELRRRLGPSEGFATEPLTLALNRMYDEPMPFCRNYDPTYNIFDVDGDGVPDLLAGDDSGWNVLRYSLAANGTEALAWQPVGFDTDYGSASRGGLVLGDLNGDGLMDISKSSSGQVTVWLNTGNGEFVRRTMARPSGAPSGYAPKGTVLFDHDADGRIDLLEHWRDSPGYSYNVALSPNAFVTELTAHAVDDLNVLIDYDGTGEVVQPGRFRMAADIDGDGNVDLFGEQGVFYGSGKDNFLLDKVVDGVGNVTRVQYEPAYESTCTGSTWPETCAKTMTGLVSGYSEGFIKDSTGAELGERSFEFKYENARYSTTGHGWLGFERQTVKVHDGDPLAPASTTTTIEFEPPARYTLTGESTTSAAPPYVYPLAGMVKHVTIDQRISEDDSPGPLESLAVERRTHLDNTWLVGQSTYGRPFPKLVARETNVYDRAVGSAPAGNGWVLATHRETFDVTALGQVHRHEEEFAVADDVFEKRETTLFYLNDTNNWLISQPTSLAIRSERGGDTHTPDINFGYDSSGLLNWVRRIGDSTQTHQTTYHRDDFGNPIEIVETAGPTDPARSTSITYDGDNVFPATITDPVGQVQVHFDERFGLPATIVDPNSVLVQHSYDGLGLRGTTVDAQGTTVYGYQPIALPPAIGTSTSIQYTEAGGIYPRTEVSIARHGPAGSNAGGTVLQLDNRGRTVRTTSEGFGGVPVISERVFDQRGRLTGQTQAHVPGATVVPTSRYFYDLMNRLTGVQHSDGTSAQRQYASRASLKSERANWLSGIDCGDGTTTGNCAVDIMLEIDETTREKNVLVTDYAGLVLRSIDGNNVATAAKTSNYAYGAFGWLLATRDNLDHVSSFQYDDYGRLLHSSDPETIAKIYTYNGYDELVTANDATGRLRTFGYDTLGRLTSMTDAAGTTGWTYDIGANALGRLSSMTSPGTPENPGGQRIDYTYEPVSTPNRALLERVDYVIDGIYYTVGYDHDDLGRTSNIDYPDLGNGPAVSVNYHYDPSGVLSSATQATAFGESPLWVMTEAFQGHLVKSEQFGNLATTTYGYTDAQHWLQNIQTSLNASTIQNLTYTYTGNGQVFSRNNAVDHSNLKYDYDPLDRLDLVTYTPEGGASTSTDYGYDDVGNLTTRGAGTVTYSSSRPHLVDTVSVAAGSGSNIYHYTLDGNLDLRSGPNVPGGTQTITYTSFDLPRSITSGSGSSAKTTQFEYSASEGRLVRRDPDTTRHFVSNLYQRLETPTGTTLEERFRLYAGSRLIGEIVRADGTDKTLYFHQDHLGSPQTTTTDTGASYVTEYGPFGEQTVAPPTELTRVGFTGHDHDSDLGLIDMKGRMYDPLAGSFASADPFVQAPFFSQGLNRYAYVFNDPINNTDPSGFCIATTLLPPYQACYPNVAPSGEFAGGSVGDSGSGVPGLSEAGPAAGVVQGVTNILATLRIPTSALTRTVRLGPTGSQAPTSTGANQRPQSATGNSDGIVGPGQVREGPQPSVAGPTGGGNHLGAVNCGPNCSPLDALDLVPGGGVAAKGAVGLGMAVAKATAPTLRRAVAWLLKKLGAKATTTAARAGGEAIKTTAHGAERIAGAAATRGGVLSEAGVAAVRQGGRVMTQADGATVRILQNAGGRFNVVVEGERGIITTFENLSQKSLDRLGKNYGWQ